MGSPVLSIIITAILMQRGICIVAAQLTPNCPSWVSCSRLMPLTIHGFLLDDLAGLGIECTILQQFPIFPDKASSKDSARWTGNPFLHYAFWHVVSLSALACSHYIQYTVYDGYTTLLREAICSFQVRCHEFDRDSISQLCCSFFNLTQRKQAIQYCCINCLSLIMVYMRV